MVIKSGDEIKEQTIEFIQPPVYTIIECINRKRIDYINKYATFPNSISINKQMLFELQMYYMNLFEMEYEQIHTIYGMKIYLVEDIEKLEDISVWYEKPLSV